MIKDIIETNLNLDISEFRTKQLKEIFMLMSM